MANLGRRAALLAATLLALAASGGPLVEAGPGAAHPYFNDRGTLTWYRSFEEARAAARAEGRLLFIEFGRRECRNCRVIVETILPATGIRERMASLCVGFAAECDSPDPRVEALFARHLPGANALPFVAFTTPDLEWISGWPGVAGADVLLQHLRAAEARRPARPVRAAPPVERHEAPPAVRVAAERACGGSGAARPRP